MPAQPCAPPASLALWAATLLAGAGLLVVMALAPLEPGRWRMRGFGTLRLLGALAAVGLAGWSLLLRARVQAAYDALASRYQQDPYYCYGGPHAPLGPHLYWVASTTALADTFQRQTLITAGATIALLLVVVAFSLLAWRRVGGRAIPAGASTAAAETHARRRWRPGRGRALALLLLFALIVASLGEFTLIQVRSAQAQMALTAPCPSTVTAADLQQIQAAGISLIPSRDTMLVDAQAARAASRQGLGQFLPSNAACVEPAPDFVDSSTIPEVPRFAIVWVVGYRIPGAVAGPGVLATPPSEEWTFVDAQSGVYLYGAFISSVGG